MAMSFTTAAHALPCGSTVEAVWEDMEAGRPAGHGIDCPHCGTARASLEHLTEATRILINDQEAPPAGLLDRIMTAVRADLGLGQTLPLPTSAGDVDISAYALVAVLRYVVDGVDGVRAHQCRVQTADDQPGGQLAGLRIWMSVALRFGSGQVAALEQARHRVTSALPERIGLNVVSLDFEVVDVWIEPVASGDPL